MDLGLRCKEYSIIVYENNSTDNTMEELLKLYKEYKCLHIISEQKNFDILRGRVHHTWDHKPSRIYNIVYGRNCLLSKAKESIYDDFDVVVMFDCDVQSMDVEEGFIDAFQNYDAWDALFAFGTDNGSPTKIYDLYAHRDYDRYKFGPEVMGDAFYALGYPDLPEDPIFPHWIPVKSSYGGLALYKKKCIQNLWFNDVVDTNVENYYKQTGFYVGEYIYNSGYAYTMPLRPVVGDFFYLHCQMVTNGDDKLFISRKLKLINDRV